MSLDFSVVVNVNSLLALKDFNTFLFNHVLHDKPSWLERRLIGMAEKWVELQARRVYIELKSELKGKEINLKLNDVDARLFGTLYLCKQEDVTVGSGHELFMLLSETILEFERLKKPKAAESYNPPLSNL